MHGRSIAFGVLILALGLTAGYANGIRADRGPSGSSPSGTVGQSQPPIFAARGEVLATNRLDIDFSMYQVTFLELGADRCIPCKKMQPIMKEIAAAFPDRVQVVFYDVWKDPAPAEKYGIQLIPTQIFVDQKGKEIARHVGLFPKEEILDLLKKHGIQ
ncbi:MAG TPA: thioredoxin family protein [Candidatus Aminicenantes bacterium]|nr:thioredoxin family protein [Candidatus Aminicenantes bacterium]HRY63919.1 thioredoxin family protein [Candidatus Aminicenantes bacterium]HRZ70832.1 thioredoxin family protein [Candidatus Aminicenantes bacterium]